MEAGGEKREKISCILNFADPKLEAVGKKREKWRVKIASGALLTSSVRWRLALPTPVGVRSITVRNVIKRFGSISEWRFYLPQKTSLLATLITVSLCLAYDLLIKAG